MNLSLATKSQRNFCSNQRQGEMNEENQKTGCGLSIWARLFSCSSQVLAAVGDQGVDWAVYQGDQGRFGYAHDKFALIQIGGYNGNGLYNQHTYSSQVQSVIAQGKRSIPMFGLILGEIWV